MVWASPSMVFLSPSTSVEATPARETILVKVVLYLSAMTTATVPAAAIGRVTSRVMVDPNLPSFFEAESRRSTLVVAARTFSPNATVAVEDRSRPPM